MSPELNEHKAIPKRWKVRPITGRGLPVLMLVALLGVSLLLAAGDGAAGPGRVWPYAGWVEMEPGSASGEGLSASSGAAVAPALTGGNLIWQDNRDGTWQIRGLRWNGDHWRPAGAVTDNSGSSTSPAIAHFDGSSVCAAWRDWSSGHGEIYVRCREWGTAWEELGTGSASGGGVSQRGGSSTNGPTIAGSEAQLFVAYDEESGGSSEVFVVVWDGSGWKSLPAGGSASSTAAASTLPALALDSAGTPYLAWREVENNQTHIFVRRWNGSAWVEVGAGSGSGSGISQNSGGGGKPAIIVGPDDKPVVAWSGDGEIYVRRWNGSAWAELGSGAGTGGGISNNAGDSRLPALAVEDDGTYCVAWQDDSSGVAQVYVRCFDGSEWQEVGIGEGSAGNGGISESTGGVGAPAIFASDSGALFVAWSTQTDGGQQIYLRMFYKPFAPYGFAWLEGQMNQPRERHTATLLSDGTVLIAGGCRRDPDMQVGLASAEIYDPETKAFTPVTDLMAAARTGHGAVLLHNGRVLLVGGDSGNTAELYDPALGGFLQPLPKLTSGATPVRLPDGRVVVFGDVQPELYDPADNQFHALTAESSCGGGRTATLLPDGRVLVTGGRVYGQGRCVEVYDPAEDEFTAMPPLLSERYGHTATLLLDGRVYLSGGSTSAMSDEIYDPETGESVDGGTCASELLGQEAVRLKDGRVLLSGGATSLLHFLTNAAALWDPQDKSCTYLMMTQVRAKHAATLLSSGDVLLTGGAREEEVWDEGISYEKEMTNNSAELGLVLPLAEPPPPTPTATPTATPTPPSTATPTATPRPLDYMQRLPVIAAD